MTSAKPHRKRIHLSNFSYMGGSRIYFITLCTNDKARHFSTDDAAAIIRQELDYRRKAGEVQIFCYCIMPDHLHVLLSVSERYPKNLQSWVSAFKRYTAKGFREKLNIGDLWQKNFFDHVVREDDSLIHIAEYIVNNPVRKGIVGRWDDYPYSRFLDPLPM